MSNALFLGIRTNGTLWGCGRNQNGQVGDGTFINRSSPVQIGTLSGWQSLGENATLQHQTSQMLKN
jgi:alpha-tubulin suppressor-like RCC1 family protein